MNKNEFPLPIVQVLKTCHFAYLCTTNLIGKPHITPVFFFFDENTNEIFIFMYSGSKKIRNIQLNPKVCITVDVRDYRNPFENQGVMVQGEALIEKIINPPSNNQTKKLLTINKEFSKKYPLINKAPNYVKYREFADVIVKISAHKIVYWKGPHFISININQKYDRN